MSFSEKLISAIVTAISIFLFPSLTFSASFDDVLNYKSPPPQVLPKNVQPYTVQEIISILPNALDEKGAYDQHGAREDWFLEHYENDPRAIAFSEENFGSCRNFYIQSRHHWAAGPIFEDTLYFIFPSSEDSKTRARIRIQSGLNRIEEDMKSGNIYATDNCTDWKGYEARLKEILNTVIQAAPAILQAKKNMVAIAQASQAKGKADERIRQKKDEENSNKLKACQNTNEYKLYETSISIVNGQQTINNAEQTIQREKDGARISGYVNKQVMYQMGSLISRVNRQNDENFDKYRKLGGSAWRIGSVKATPNPCNF